MAFTAELFRQIVENLKSDDGRRYDEQRNRPRVGVRGRVDIKLMQVGDRGIRTLSVWIRDLSVNGIGILHSKPLPNDSKFIAHFPRCDDAPLAITYVVAYSKQVSKGLYVVGARMVGAAKTKAA